MAQVLDLRLLQVNLSKSKPQSLYFVFGEELYLVDESVKLLKSAVLTGGAVEFNFDQYYASDSKPSQVRDAVEMLPMMCDRRLVILKQAHLLKEKDWAELMPVLQNPTESCVFILVAEKVDRRKKYFKTLQKAATLVELKKPYDNQVLQWVQYIANNNELSLGRNEAALIQQLVGNNLTEINSEIQKLKQFVGEASGVSQEQILKVISKSRVDSIFDLTDAIGEKNKIKALSSLSSLMDNGQNEVGALMLIARHVRILSKVKVEQKKGSSSQQMMQVVGVPNFFLKRYITQANAWSEERLVGAFDHLHEVDIKIKTSKVPPRVWLENFIFKTC